MFESIVPLIPSRPSEIPPRRPPGCFVEVGVYRGGTALHLHEIADRQLRQLHLFDTFSGMPYQGSDDKHAVGISQIPRLSPSAGLPRAIFHVGVSPTRCLLTSATSLLPISTVTNTTRRGCITQLFPLLVPAASCGLMTTNWPALDEPSIGLS